MNYPRGLKKAAIAKRILLSWLVVAGVFLVIGFGLGVFAAGS